MHPVLFHIGSLPVRAYGTMVVIGFLLCLWRTMRVCARRMATEPEGSPRRIHPDTIFDVGLFSLFVGLIGARVLFVLLDWPNFVKNPANIFRLWEGGLSLHGSMIFGTLFLIIYCRAKKLSFWVVADLAGVAYPLAYAFGRVGCLLNGCCYGSACNLPWAVVFPDEHLAGAFTPPSHPVQAYGTLINLFIFWAMTRWERRPHRDGELFFGYIGLYGLYRGAVETFRAGATSTYLIPALHLTETHVISAVMVVVGAIGIVWLRRTRPAVQDAVFQNVVPSATPNFGI